MPEIGNLHVASIGYRDATDEVGDFEVFVGAITAVSIAGFLTDFGNLQTATDNITLGVRARQSWIGDRTTVSNAIPTNKAAQRECKLRVKYQGNTTEKPFTVSIPTVEFDKLVFLPGGKDAVAFKAANGAHADIIAWVTAFQTIARSPDDELENVTVIGMRFIGANT